MNKLTYFLTLLAAIIIAVSCKKDTTDNSKTENFTTFIANGINYSFDFCVASQFSQISQNETKKFVRFLSGLDSNFNDSNHILEAPCLSFTIENPETKTYYRGDFITWTFMIQFYIGESVYFFPQSVNDTKGDFEITLNEYDLEKQVISGTFHGRLYNYSNTADSLVIENGKFKGNLYLSPTD